MHGKEVLVYLHAPEDEEHLLKLDKHLAMAKRQEGMETWHLGQHLGQVLAGGGWSCW